MNKAPFIILVLLLMCNVCCVFAQDIANGDMEEWTALGDSNKEHPIGWTTRNHLENNPQANYSLQVNDSYKGDKAILLQNFKPSPGVSLASFLSLGGFDAEHPGQKGVSFEHRPVSLNFAYKYFTTKANPSGFYQAKASIRLTRWDDANNVSVLVAEGEYSIVHKTNVYIPVVLDLVYYETTTPDSLYLIFTTPSNPEDQIRFTIDDIHLMYHTTTGTDEPDYPNEVSLYPNPANAYLNVQQTALKDESQLLIYDSLGRLQMQHRLAAIEETVDIAILDSGFYFYQIRTGNELVKTGKFLKSIN